MKNLIAAVIVAAGLASACSREDKLPRSFSQARPTADQLAEYRAVALGYAKMSRPLAPLFDSAILASPELFDRLAIKPTDVIADIGCGAGAFELSILEKLLPFGGLYAVDIDRDALSFLEFLLTATDYPNRRKVVPVESAMGDVRLPPESIDIALINDTTAFNARLTPGGMLGFDSKGQACLQTLKDAMKTGGRVYYFFPMDSPTPEPRRFEIVVLPFQAAGFKLADKDIFLVRTPRKEERHYHLLFEK